MRRFLPAILALTIAGPTLAQRPPYPYYPEVKAHVEASSVADLAREMFNGEPPDKFWRAGGVAPHPSNMGVVWLWTRPVVVERRQSGPVLGVCQLRQATSLSKSLDPPIFDAPKFVTLYKAIPRARVSAPDDPAALAAFCEDQDPRTFGEATDAAVVAEATQTLYNFFANPMSATIIRSFTCVIGRPGPLCGMKAEDLESQLLVIPGDCGDDWFRAYANRSTSKDGRQDCLFVNTTPFGINMVMTRGSSPSIRYGQALLSGGSQTFLSERR